MRNFASGHRQAHWLIALVFACAAGCEAPQATQSPPPPPEPKPLEVEPPADPELAELAGSIDAAHDYLLGALDQDGRFEYRINLSGKKPKPKYNVLRHAGTVYALGDHYERNRSLGTKDAIARATRYLMTHYVRPPDGKPDNVLAVFSDPEEESLDTGKPEAKLGGAALALLALHAAHTTQSMDVDLEAMRGLGRFIVFMQKPDGSFESKYSETEGFLNFRSLYYPGEAILALVRLYEVDPDPRWLEAAARGTAQLVRSREGDTNLPNDHWLMIAIEPLLQHYGDLKEPPIPKEEIAQHALALGLEMVEEQEYAAKSGGPPGAFDHQGKCTPAATRLEGLIALWRSMEGWGEQAQRERIRASIDDGVEFVQTCQVEEGPAAGGVLRAQKPLASADARFNRRQSEIRIDYVQHALSAMNGARDLQKAGALTARQ